MLSNHTIDAIGRELNQAVIKRLLIKYFYEKGFEDSFNLRIYPPSMRDLVEMVPQLEGKIEIVPHAEEIDPRSGYTKLGWNLFVLGNQRMFLGYSEHDSLQELVRESKTAFGPVVAANAPSRGEATPRRVIAFVCRILGQSEQGFIRSSKLKRTAPHITRTGVGAAHYNRPNMVRPENANQ